MVVVRRQRFEFIQDITREQAGILRDAFREALAEVRELPTDRPRAVERQVLGRIRDAFTMNRPQRTATREFERRLQGYDANGVRTAFRSSPCRVQTIYAPRQGI